MLKVSFGFGKVEVIGGSRYRQYFWIRFFVVLEIESFFLVYSVISYRVRWLEVDNFGVRVMCLLWRFSCRCGFSGYFRGGGARRVGVDGSFRQVRSIRVRFQEYRWRFFTFVGGMFGRWGESCEVVLSLDFDSVQFGSLR